MEYHLYPLGDHAVMIELGSKIQIDIHKKVQGVAASLDAQPPEWMIEYIPAFSTVTVFYDPVRLSNFLSHDALHYEYVCQQIHQLLNKSVTEKNNRQRIVEIPVCYGGDMGPDLETVARINDITTDEVIHIHSSGDYLVYMIGFAPGFPYMGGMSEEIAAPRKESPRLKIPARSVGIGGNQTGIYPIETPGGWQLIGRTPTELFRPWEKEPSLLKAGDKIQFKPISLLEYKEWEERNN